MVYMRVQNKKIGENNAQFSSVRGYRDVIGPTRIE